MVIAKFRVERKTEFPKTSDSDARPFNVEMYPVQGEPFGKYTPSGKIEMYILNDAAADQFIPGKEYLVEFRPAE